MRNPIGIFDSGVGGLSIVKQIRKHLPDESINYFADSGNCPYGSKPESETIYLCKKNIEFLMELNCKLIVIACNTVTSVAIDIIRKEYAIPFIGIEPALKPAFFYTKNKKIGILATENTFKGKLFKETLEKYSKGIEVFFQPGYGLVELVEQDDIKGEKVKSILEKYIDPMIEKGVDTIVLGCTHYSFLYDTIEKITNASVKVIEPSDAVAVQTKRILHGLNLAAKDNSAPEFNFYTTGKKTIAKKFLTYTMGCKFEVKKIPA